MKKMVLLFVLTASLLAGCDYSPAKLLAHLGSADAQLKLGKSYYSGEDVNQDYIEAAKWYLRAAEQGNAEAQIHLGYMYYEGVGVEQDDSNAAFWYREAAKNNNAEAQYGIGFMYEEGIGVGQDFDEALK